MRFTVTPNESQFLYRILFNPYLLPLGAARTFGPQGMPPYRPPGAGKDAVRSGKMFHMLKNWFNAHVAVSVKTENFQSVHEMPKDDRPVGLKQSYADLLISILEHYEPVGLLAEYVDVYPPLLAKLKGENYAVEDASESAGETT